MTTKPMTGVLAALVLWCGMLLAAAALSTGKGAGATRQAEASPLPVSFEDVNAAYLKVDDYRCVFSKTEFLEGRMKQEKMEMLFRKPHDVKFAWITPKKGQKAVFLQGRNDNKLRARKGGLLSLIAVNLDPLGDRAMEDNRHPITQAGLGYLIQKTLEDIAKGQFELKYLGDQPVEGRPCWHLEFASKGPQGFHYALRTEFWIDQELKLPIQSKHFDYDNRWIETYTYSQLKLNVGLRDSDFDI
jgi:outer membrane lipoprotein-sorting protein